MSEEKKISKCGRGRKKCKCRISGVRKKKGIERKVPRKKNQSVLGGNLKLKLRFAEKKKSGIFIYWVRTHWLGAMLIENSITWANWKI